MVKTWTSEAKKRSKIIPEISEATAMVPKYNPAVIFPRVEETVAMVAIFVAGPHIKKTRAAPGDNPLATRAAAMGTEPVAQI